MGCGVTGMEAGAVTGWGLGVMGEESQGMKGRGGGQDGGGGGVKLPSRRPATGLGPEEGGLAGLGTFPGPCARPASHLSTVDPLFPQPPT